MATLSRLVGAAAVGAIAAVAVIDRRNTDQPVRAMLPVTYWGRKLTTKLGPLLRQYIVEDDAAERPFDRATRNWVYASARDKQNTIAFGATYRSDEVGAVVFSPKTFTNEAATLEPGQFDDVALGSRMFWRGKRTEVVDGVATSFKATLHIQPAR